MFPDVIQPSLKFNSAKEHNVFINEDSTMFNDVIQPSLKFNSAKEHNVFINEDSTMLMLKDWAWKFECDTIREWNEAGSWRINELIQGV